MIRDTKSAPYQYSNKAVDGADSPAGVEPKVLDQVQVNRKVIGGFRTEDGAAAYATYRTIEDTARKRGQPILQALYDVLGHQHFHPVCFSSHQVTHAANLYLFMLNFAQRLLRDFRQETPHV